MADAVEAAEQDIRIIQSMIDFSAQRLEGLRTQCATSAELTQQEIRTLEGKLIKLFSNQLIAKSKLRNGSTVHVPSLMQWLQVVGLGTNSIQGICQKVSTVEELQEKTEHELKTILNERGARSEELSRLCRALHNLKRCTDVLRRGENDNFDMHLYWDSWDRHQNLKSVGLSPRSTRSRVARASVPSEESLTVYNNNNNTVGGAIPASTSVSSINSLNAQCVLGPPLTPPPVINPGKGNKFPTTPPPRRKHLTSIQNSVLLPDSYPLTKSKSHESQLVKGDNGEIDKIVTAPGTVIKRSRLPTEPGPDTDSSSILTSPIKSPPGTDSDENCQKSATNLMVPKSPRTPTPTVRNMTHQINHRFTKTFKVMSTCGYCTKPIYFGTGLKCKECKYKCHRECETRVAPSCGLTPELLEEFKKKVSYDASMFPSPNSTRASSNTKNIINSWTRIRKRSHPQPTINISSSAAISSQTAPDSSSNTSSCNSSTPSSPAVAVISTGTPTTLPLPNQQRQFHFPEVARDDSDLTNESLDKTPVRVDSQDSQVSDSETTTDGHKWPRQNSMSMREWDIPYEELRINDIIGYGRFGTVHRGYWHGDVAVKVLNMTCLNDEKALEQFRNEVSTFRKTRHENVILFMGACMQPPKLAIVTSLSKGMTLYTHLHLRKDKFNMNKTTSIAQQISQGMGYLHARGIIHKDLKTKNIFFENGKVVITDFGLSVTKLCFGNRKNDGLWIPHGWLHYLSPEIVKKLHAHQLYAEELPFSEASDVYAFGTVWYELLCSDWPFKSQPPEAIIWQVGKGIKQPLANLQATRDVKDILMLCWSFRVEDRPDFIRLGNILEKLPKKRLARSPSHPIHLSRSAESVF